VYYTRQTLDRSYVNTTTVPFSCAQICDATGDEQAKLIGRMVGTNVWRRDAQWRYLNNNDGAADERVEKNDGGGIFFFLKSNHTIFEK